MYEQILLDKHLWFHHSLNENALETLYSITMSVGKVMCNHWRKWLNVFISPLKNLLKWFLCDESLPNTQVNQWENRSQLSPNNTHIQAHQRYTRMCVARRLAAYAWIPWENDWPGFFTSTHRIYSSCSKPQCSNNNNENNKTWSGWTRHLPASTIFTVIWSVKRVGIAVMNDEGGADFLLFIRLWNRMGGNGVYTAVTPGERHETSTNTLIKSRGMCFSILASVLPAKPRSFCGIYLQKQSRFPHQEHPPHSMNTIFYSGPSFLSAQFSSKPECLRTRTHAYYSCTFSNWPKFAAEMRSAEAGAK